MATLPCDYCHRVPKARLYTLIWAWQADRERIAVKTRACAEDLLNASAALGVPLTEEGDYIQLPNSCPRCSDPFATGDVTLTWLTYWDANGEHRPSFAHCPPCASELHAALVSSGEAMADRPLSLRRRAA